jgi:hypothetical protein
MASEDPLATPNSVIVIRKVNGTRVGDIQISYAIATFYK